MNHPNDHHSRMYEEQYKKFVHAKTQCLSKYDKSSTGRFDHHVIEICSLINQYDHYYTTSSCSGRSFIYTGIGIKSTSSFIRYRISHEPIHTTNQERYFNLSTLQSDPTGGGDIIVSTYDGGKQQRKIQRRRRFQQQQPSCLP